MFPLMAACLQMINLRILPEVHSYTQGPTKFNRNSDRRAPLDSIPALSQLLPAETPARSLCLTTRQGLAGQLAKASVYLESVMLPQGEDLALDRPRAATYYAIYR